MGKHCRQDFLARSQETTSGSVTMLGKDPMDLIPLLCSLGRVFIHPIRGVRGDLSGANFLSHLLQGGGPELGESSFGPTPTDLHGVQFLFGRVHHRHLGKCPLSELSDSWPDRFCSVFLVPGNSR